MSNLLKIKWNSGYIMTNIHESKSHQTIFKSIKIYFYWEERSTSY